MLESTFLLLQNHTWLERHSHRNKKKKNQNSKQPWQFQLSDYFLPHGLPALHLYQHWALLQQIVVYQSRNYTAENQMLVMMIKAFLGFPYALIITAAIIHSVLCSLKSLQLTQVGYTETEIISWKQCESKFLFLHKIILKERCSPKIPKQNLF